jgi:competence protein ComEC
VIADRVDQVWVGPVLQPDHRDIVRGLESAGATVNEVSAGNSLPFGRYRLRVVWPLTDSFADAGNDSSVVVAVEPDRPCTYCLSGVFLGDLGEEPQRILLAREDFGSLDVVKVSHHGSRDQFAGLYQKIDATVGLIGVGEDNTYGHPTQSALDILSLAGTVPLRSDEKGIITLSPGEKGQLSIWSQR